MKVIDILNKIANGEEVVAKHKMFDLEFFNSKDFHIGYRKGIDKFILGDIVKALNDEVEIIGEDKKIEKLKIETQNKEYTRKCIDTVYYYNLGVNRECLTYRYTSGKLSEFKGGDD